MATAPAPEAAGIAEGMGRRWLWAVRGITLGSLLLVVAGAVHNPKWLLITWPLLVCYLMVLLGLGKQPKRWALVVAQVVGLLLMVLLGIGGLVGGKFAWDSAVWLGLGLTQAALLVGATKLLGVLPPEVPLGPEVTPTAAPPVNRRWLWVVRGITGGLLVFFVLFLPTPLFPFVVLSSPLLVCYVVILVGLLGKQPKRWALVVARVAGLFVLVVLAGLVGVFILSEGVSILREVGKAEWKWGIAFLWILGFTYATLVVGASKLLPAVPREPACKASSPIKRA